MPRPKPRQLHRRAQAVFSPLGKLHFKRDVDRNRRFVQSSNGMAMIGNMKFALTFVAVVLCAAAGLCNAQETQPAKVSAALNMSALATAGPTKISGSITYQICDDKVCYAPQSTPFEVETKIVAAGESVQANQPELFGGFDPSVFARLVKAAPQAQRVMIFGHDLDQAPLFFTFFAALVIGIIFIVVSCVLPVVPLTAFVFYVVSLYNRSQC